MALSNGGGGRMDLELLRSSLSLILWGEGCGGRGGYGWGDLELLGSSRSLIPSPSLGSEGLPARGGCRFW